METIAKITDADFEEIIKSEAVSLIIFSAANCGYCYLLKDNILEAAEQIQGLDLYECETDQAPEAVQRYSVKSVPQFKVFQKGEIVYTGLGVPRTADLYYQLKPLVRDSSRLQQDWFKDNDI